MIKTKHNSFRMVSVVLLSLSFASQLKQKKASGSKETNFSPQDCREDPSEA